MLVRSQSCILYLDLWVSIHAGQAIELCFKSRSVGLATCWSSHKAVF